MPFKAIILKIKEIGKHEEDLPESEHEDI